MHCNRVQAEVEALRCDINLPSPASSSRDPSETIAAVYPPSSALHQSLRAQHSTSMGPSKYSSPAFRERPVSAATTVQSPSSPRISASPRGYSGQVKVRRTHTMQPWNCNLIDLSTAAMHVMWVLHWLQAKAQQLL